MLSRPPSASSTGFVTLPPFLFWRLCVSGVPGICFIGFPTLFFCLVDSDLISGIPNFFSFPLLQGKTDTQQGCICVFVSRFAYRRKALVFKSHMSTLRYRRMVHRCYSPRDEVLDRATPGLCLNNSVCLQLSCDFATARTQRSLINSQGVELGESC